AGMSLDDIEKVAMDPATVVSAFSSAQVEAAGIWYPMIDNIKQQVPDLVELAQNSDFADVMQFPNVMVTGAEYPEKNEETTLAVLKVLRSAMDHRVDDLDGTIELVAKMTDSDAEAVAGDAANGEYYKAADLDALVEDGTIETWLTAMNEYFEKNGKIEGETVAPADFYTFDLFTKAGERPSRPLRTTLLGSVPPGRATSCRSSPTSTAPTPWAATATPWCAPRTWMPSPAAAPASTAGTRRARSARPPGPACSPVTRPSATSCWRTTNATSATRRTCPTGSSPSPSRCGRRATTADCWANGTPGPRSCEATTASTVPSCRAGTTPWTIPTTSPISPSAACRPTRSPSRCAAPCPTAAPGTCSPHGCTSPSRRPSSTTSPTARPNSCAPTPRTRSVTAHRSTSPCTSTARTCRTSSRTSTSTCTTRSRSSCPPRCRRPSWANRRCRRTTRRTGRSTP